MMRVIAIDGPAGAGKSSASRGLAQRLGFAYVDTGAMYRVVGVLAHEQGVAFDDDDALAALCAGIEFEVRGERLAANGRDLSEVIRRRDAGDLASRVSTRPVVRERLVTLQRALGAKGRVVMEGRDIGTVVFPDAPLKFFLTADPMVRAQRRAAELAARGETVDVVELGRELAERDRRDRGRATAPLKPADDAIVLDTSTLALEAVIAEMERVARERLSLQDPGAA
jgi:cytidylate kinase